MPPHVVICGVSTRAAAASAARAGCRVTAIDAYADLDQHPGVRALSVVRDLGGRASAPSMARAARGVACDAVAYLSNFENHPRAVAALAAGRALWGNPPEVLRRVRDPFELAGALRRRGFAVPALRSRAGDRPIASNEPAGARPAGLTASDDPHAWLVKPLRSGGGQRVAPWQGGAVPRTCYVQQRIHGTPGSIVFVAAGGRAVPLGLSRQLAGEADFGAAGFRYCGSIMAPPDDPQFERGDDLLESAQALAAAVAAEFSLVGLNGVDFVARDGVPHAIEVNPRWSASMELVEPLAGLTPFAAHVEACTAGRLPRVDLRTALRRAPALGKAIVFAPRPVTAGDTRRWLDDPAIRDVPHPGEPIAAGQPVCTVLARAATAQACHDALVERARRICAELVTAHPVATIDTTLPRDCTRGH
jgi:predicted ATP-grasp superfamily ATP-dependent carboligase